MPTTLKRRAHALADPERQRARLAELQVPGFAERIAGGLRAGSLEVLQINVGRRCNQICAHCHVDAGPDRREVMGDEVLDACFALLETGAFPVLDITGGAPELHPRFEEIVERGARAGVEVLHRCNLTAIRLPAYRHLPQLLARHRVRIIASLPALAEACTDSQRGTGVFTDSIASLRELNELGYGEKDSGLVLDLVTNPIGASLPGEQSALEAEFRQKLDDGFGIRFNQLLALTNMPVSRFLEWLDASDQLEPYMQTLVDAFNPCAAAAVMCRSHVSVGWDGRLFDCDFNQMLDLEADAPSVLNLDPAALVASLRSREIRTGAHCYGCTAGAGSGCQGAVT
jgi:radical SAM/Cys-rich protein